SDRSRTSPGACSACRQRETGWRAVMAEYCVWLKRRRWTTRWQLRMWAVAALLALSAAGRPATGAMRTTQPLTVTSLGSGAQGEARAVVRRARSGLNGTLVVVV